MSIEHTFSKPVKFEGQEHASIKMNVEAMTGRDISKIKNQWAQAGKFSPVPATDLDFCAMVGAESAKMPIEFMDALPAREYLAVCQKVGNFLMGSD